MKNDAMSKDRPLNRTGPIQPEALGKTAFKRLVIE